MESKVKPISISSIPIPELGHVGAGHSSGPGAAGGMQVYIENCLICSSQCYVPPKMELEDRERIAELREVFYEVYEIPVSSAFISGSNAELPLCPSCIFKLGRMRTLYEQLTSIQREYIRLREGIAFDIVDFVASNNAGFMDLKSQPQEVIQRYLKNAEVDTLQHLIFEDWHERYSTDLEDNFNVNNYLPPSPMKTTKPIRSQSPPKSSMTNNNNGKTLMKRPPGTRTAPPSNPVGRPLKSIKNAGNNLKRIQLPSAASQSNISKGLINGKASTFQPNKQGRKTTVISITTDDGNGNSSKKGPSVPSSTIPTSNKTNKRKLDLDTVAIKGEDKRSKSIEIVVGEDGNNIIEDLVREEDDGDMVIAMSPSRFHDQGDGDDVDNPDLEFEQEQEEYPHELEGTEEDEQLETNGNNKRNSGRGSNIRNSAESGGSGSHEDQDMDFGDLRSYLDLLESNEGEEVDPERQKYLENIIAQLQAGGNNIEFQQNPDGLYVCMFCNKTFIHKYPYRDHLKTHTGEGPRCPICNKIFPKNHNLMLHLRTHTGEKPFQCDICKKGFADKSNLKVHYRVHTGEKPYQCEFCELKFVNSSRLVVHRRLHTGERPFPCDLCGKSFSTSNQLTNHRKIHGVDQMDDSVEGY